MMEWKTYTNNRLIAEHPSGFFVIKPSQTDDEVMPMFCCMCDYIMNSIYDEEAYRKFGCCDSCANHHVYPNMKKWKEGWRPSSEEVLNKRKTQ